MTAEELQNKIEFRIEETPYGIRKMAGKLVVHGSVSFDKATANDVVMDWARKEVTELIMRCLYKDQRRELYEAIDQLLVADHFDYQKISAARERILSAARRQSPVEAPSLD